MSSFPNHRAARTDEGVRGRLDAPFSMASFGCSAPALLGLTCLSGIPRIKLAIGDFNSGCDRASCGAYSKRWLKICVFKAGSM